MEQRAEELAKVAVVGPLLEAQSSAVLKVQLKLDRMILESSSFIISFLFYKKKKKDMNIELYKLSP